MVNEGFWNPHTLHYHPQLARWLSYKTAATRGDVFIRFLYSWPFAPLCFFNQLLTRCKPAMPLKYCTTQHRWVIKRFYKQIPHFCSCKFHFTTKFYRGKLFKIFSVVIYNTSTKHTILQNAHILPYIDGLTLNFSVINLMFLHKIFKIFLQLIRSNPIIPLRLFQKSPESPETFRKIFNNYCEIIISKCLKKFSQDFGQIIL